MIQIVICYLIHKFRLNGIMQFLSRVILKMKLNKAVAYLLVFFSVYLNKLIEILRTSNVGCRYGSQYMGVYCYADDLSLLSPSFTGLQEMLRLCELYAIDHNIIFNAKKESVIVFRF